MRRKRTLLSRPAHKYSHSLKVSLMSLYLFVRQMRISLEDFLVKLEIVPESVLVLECESVGGEQPLVGLPDLDHVAVLCYICP